MLLVEILVGLFAAAVARERDITPEVGASLRSDFVARLARAAPTALAFAYGDDPG